MHLCWGHEFSISFQVGVFQLSGPFTGVTGCTLTEACTLQLAGVELSSSNVVRIVASGSACGDDVVAVSTFVGLAATTSAAAAAPDLYALSTGSVTGGTAGALYRLCWSSAPGYFVRVYGPLRRAVERSRPQRYECSSGGTGWVPVRDGGFGPGGVQRDLLRGGGRWGRLPRLRLGHGDRGSCKQWFSALLASIWKWDLPRRLLRAFGPVYAGDVMHADLELRAAAVGGRFGVDERR